MKRVTVRMMKLDQYLEILRILSRHRHNCFVKCAEDRERIFNSEDEPGQDILIDMMDISRAIDGIVTSQMVQPKMSYDKMKYYLEESAPFKDGLVLEWLLRNELLYPDFVSFIQSIENLRGFALDVLEKHKEEYQQLSA